LSTKKWPICSAAPQSEMIGQPLFAFMDAEGIAIAQVSLNRRREGIREQLDFKFRRRDGSDLWAMVSTNSLADKQGRYVGALAMVPTLPIASKQKPPCNSRKPNFDRSTN
jgi:hypothetical protein